MGPRGKMLIGAILVVLGAWWYVPGGPFNSAAVSFSTLSNLQSLVITFQGGIGIVAIIIGAFVVWIERDEMRVRKELASRDLGQDVQEGVEPYTAGEEEDAEEETYECPKCGKEFDTQQGLHGHKGQAHSG